MFWITTSGENVLRPHGCGVAVAGGHIHPGGQRPEHALELRPRADPKVLAGQDEHSEAAPVLNVPFSHVVQTAPVVALLLVPCLPAGHAAHLSLLNALILLPQRPGGHAVHCETLVNPTAAL